MPIQFYRYKKNAHVAKFSGDETHIVIPDEYDGVPVTDIREEVFAGTDIQSVVIPETVERIGDRAFEGCKKLMQVTCYANAPTGCSILPKGLLFIGERAFAQTALLKVKILTNVVIKIGAQAFYECSRLNTIECPTTHTFMLGKGCFMRSGIEKFSAPESYSVALPEEAFSQCHELLEVKAGVTSVGKRGFYQCTWLEKFDFPIKFKIGTEAFEHCTSLKIPDRILRLPVTEDDSSCKLPENSVFNLPTAEETEPSKTADDSVLAESSCIGKSSLFDISRVVGGPVAASIQGKFFSSKDGFYFNEDDATSSSKLYFVNNRVEKLRPLFSYLSEKQIQVVLQGAVEEQTLHVCDLHPAGPLTAFPKQFLNEVARKLLCERTVETETEENKQFHLGSYNQMMTFYDLVKSAIPAWVREAFLKNAAIYNESKSSSDEQKHAETAMRYFLSIDWTPKTLDIQSNEEVWSIMEKHFYGLEVVKERIIEVLTKIRKTKTLPKYGLLLNGPPGVGKTSIARALGDILGMPLFEFDMSIFGRDPDELSGSSRIYTNARPGRLANYMYDNRTATGILLINELDKSDRYGLSAANVFLPVLDKVSSFEENFLQIGLPTENLFSIATCNGTDKISPPILDRFLVIDLPAYSKNEKRVILTDYVLPKVLNANGIECEQLTLSEEAIDLIIDEYALEAGARDLEKISERICSHCNKFFAANPNIQSKCYSAEDIVELLGPSKKVTRKLVGHPGMVTSAFYHENTAYTYLMEASVIPGTGKFEVLGGIPDQQREYCRAAYYCVRNRAAFDLSKFDIAVFSPQPISESVSNQVGFACFAAICSRLTNTCLLTDKAVFLGGIDLYGNLFFDESDITPLLKTMKASKMTTLYAPMGTAEKINLKELDDCNISIIEAPDAPALLTIAATGLKHAG